MMKRLELDSLSADLSAVEALLASRTQAEDPIGWMKYANRKAQLQQQVAAMVIMPDHHASVALFFWWSPCHWFTRHHG